MSHFLRERVARTARHSLYTLLTVAGGGLAVGSLATAQTWHVKPGASGNGSSWPTACSLRFALANAQPTDQIWVAQGTYVPGVTRASTFQLPAEVGVYGGFLGTETSLAARAGSFTATILSGDVDGNPGNTAADAYHVVTAASGGGAFDITLDGFKVTRGNANGSGADAFGGGVTLPGTLQAYVRNVTFEQNLATNGGGLHADLIQRLHVDRCTFLDNDAAAGGGGIHLDPSIGSGDFCEGDGVKIFNTLFKGNSAIEGGGLYYANLDQAFWCYNSQFYDNAASLGGGIYSGSGPYEAHIGNCTLAGNQAFDVGGAGSEGAGIYLLDFGPETFIFNTIVWGNAAQVGGIWRQGASLEGPGADQNPLVSPYVEYSDIEIKPLPLPPATAVWPGTGNLNASPSFVNQSTGDLRLAAHSACVDAGSDPRVPFDWLDLDGDLNELEQVPRDFTPTVAREINDSGVTDTGVDDTGTDSYFDFCSTGAGTADVDLGIVDMGCYERRVTSG